MLAFFRRGITYVDVGIFSRQALKRKSQIRKFLVWSDQTHELHMVQEEQRGASLLTWESLSEY